MVGNRVDVDVTDATYDGTNYSVVAITPTTVSVQQTGVADDVSSGTGTLTRYGGGTAAAIADAPTPTGSGRVSLVAAHLGSDAQSRCVYGPIEATTEIEDIAAPFPRTVRRPPVTQHGLRIA
jgi:hypothetical protein